MKLPRKLGKLPLVGAMLNFSKKPLDFMIWAQTLNEPLVYDKALGQYYFLVFDPALVEHVLIKNSKNYQKNHFLKSWNDYFGEGLLTADGERWQSDRRLIQPLFSKDKINIYNKKFNQVSSDYFASWKLGERKLVDLEMNELSMNNFLETILGVKLTHDEYIKAAKDFDDVSHYFRFAATPIGLHLSRLPLPVKRKYLGAIKSLHGLIEGIVKDKKKDLEAGKENIDLVTTLLKARDDQNKGMTEINLRDQIMTFFQAGHETTALTLGYVIHFLSLHPEKQAKLRNELNEAFPDKTIDASNFDKAPYLNSVILEAMRLYSPSWMLGRDAVKDDKMGEFDIPAKSMIIIPTWAFHRNPKTFPNPDAFEPERWTKEFESNLHKSAYLPFGLGSRMCIGATFAMFEMKYVIATLYLKFGTKLLSSPNLEVIPSVTARSKYPIEVELTE